MQFAFEFKLNGETRKTYYTKENQSLLAHSLNNNGLRTINVFHETRKGPNAGKVVMHEVNFTDMIVRNTDSGWFHKLLLTTPELKPETYYRNE